MSCIIAIVILAAVLVFMFWASYDIDSGIYLKTFCRSFHGGKAVYLTFDDGPVPGHTDKVLDILSQRKAKATFFLVGKRAEAHPELVRRILAEGHGIGNHSLEHKWNFPLRPSARILEDIRDASALIETASGTKVTFFRPPFGVTNPPVARAVKESGLQTIGWDVRSFDTLDSDRTEGRGKIISRVVRKVRPGSVILLHDRLDGSDLLLSMLLDALDSLGYRYDVPLEP